MGKIVIFLTFGAFKIIKIRNHHKVDMKKIIVGVALASVVLSCQKIQEGGNKGNLKMEHGVERYSDDQMSDEATAKVSEMQAAKAMTMIDTTKVAVQPQTQMKKDSTIVVTESPAATTTENK